MHRRSDELNATGAKVCVVAFEERRRAREWASSGEIGFPILLDPDRSVYRAYHLERSAMRSLHPRTLWFYFKKLLRGQVVTRITGDPTQLGGDFVIDEDGAIRLAYYSVDPTDRPSVASLLEALGGAG